MRVLTSLLAVAVVIGAGCGSDGSSSAARPSVDRFDSERAFALLERQVALGPRPAGSRASRRLARRLRRAFPHAR
jgi:glutaminyl-peptide cyclotransferase